VPQAQVLLQQASGAVELAKQSFGAFGAMGAETSSA
jgi:hypothetical protein